MPTSTTNSGHLRATPLLRLRRRLLCLSAACCAMAGVLLVVGDSVASANGGTITPNGSAVTATISVAAQASNWTFSGASGQVVTATVTAGTFAGGCDVNLLLLDPNGNTVTSANCVGTSGFLPQVALPGAGTYTLRLAPTNNDLGHVTLSLAANAAVIPVTANTAIPTFTSAAPGQGQEYSFVGKKIETVTVSAFSGSFPGSCDLQMYLLDANGTVLNSAGCASQTGFISETALEGKGTYYIDLVPQGQDLGNTGGKSITIALSANVANTSVTENGTPATFTTTATGQGGNLTFSGTAGQQVTVSAFNGTYPGACDLQMFLVDPIGGVIGNAGCSSQAGFIGETTLPGTGTYTIELAAQGQNLGANTGSIKVAVSKDAANLAIVENGAALTFTAAHTAEGQNYTFAGKAGQVVTVSTYGGTFPNSCDLQVLLVNQAGNAIGNGGCAAIGGFISETVLPAKGKYAVELLPQGQTVGSNTGSVHVALSLNAPALPITSGSPVTFTSTHTGTGQNYTFSGTAGETVSVATSGGTFSNNCDLTLEVISPNGTVIGNGGCGAQSDALSGVLLPGTGSYTVALVPTGTDVGSNTGSVSVDLT